VKKKKHERSCGALLHCVARCALRAACAAHARCRARSRSSLPRTLRRASAARALPEWAGVVRGAMNPAGISGHRHGGINASYRSGLRSRRRWRCSFHLLTAAT